MKLKNQQIVEGIRAVIVYLADYRASVYTLA